ncbi:MAG: BMP family ABC transporter substrate-binding protein [Clostridium sp.]|nr:BMP family ABC transporter substrate-binding protein [Clostridium sp.]
MKKRILAMLMMAVMAVSVTACGNKNGSSNSNNTGMEAESSEHNVSMVSDTAGINDQSFNQSAWEGLQSFSNETGVKVSYKESTQESDYATNLDKLVDDGSDLVWGIGFAMSDALKETAEINDDVNFAIVDNAYDEVPENVTCVTFNAQDSSFLVGYVAGLTTKTDSVGFVGGVSSSIIDQFEYGYRAGVAYAAKELGKDIKVEVQYADSFSDSAKGKAIATAMYSNGVDVIFHAAAGVGIGVIESAVENGKWVIGVDTDQAYLAPEHVLTSSLKRVDVAVADLSKKFVEGEAIGGQTYSYGLMDGGVGIPEENPNMDEEVYAKTMKVQDEIIAGKIVPAYNAEMLEMFQ